MIFCLLPEGLPTLLDSLVMHRGSFAARLRGSGAFMDCLTVELSLHSPIVILSASLWHFSNDHRLAYRGCVWAACGPLATIWIGMLYSFTLTFTPVVDVKWPILIPNLHGFWTVVEEISVLEPGCDPHCCKASELTPTLLFDPLTTNRTRTLLFSVTTS